MSTPRSRRLMEKTKTSCSSPSWSITSLTLNPCPKKLLPSARGWGFTRLIFFFCFLFNQMLPFFLSSFLLLPLSQKKLKVKLLVVFKWRGAAHRCSVGCCIYTTEWVQHEIRAKGTKIFIFWFFLYIYINMGSQDRNQIWISMNHPTLPLNWINHTACCCSPAANGL